MPGQNVDEVVVGVDGIVATAPIGSTAPTSSISTLPAAWKDLGFVTEDGVTETTEQSTEILRAWQRATRVRTLITEGEVQFAFTLMQTNADTVAFYYGGTVETDGSIIIDASVERPRFAFVLDIIDGDKSIRAYAPNCQVVEVGDQVAQTGGEVGYEVTVACSYDETLGGSVKKWYSELVTTP
jgi:hypothetical protein